MHQAAIAKIIAHYHTNKAKINVEAHRAARRRSSVGRKHHVVVQLQHSSRPRGNLLPGLGQLNATNNDAFRTGDPRDLSSTINPSKKRKSTSSTNPTKFRKMYSKLPPCEG
jgi:hypothetical protein